MLVVALVLVAGQVPVVSLSKPERTLPHAFNRISAVHELPDGRVVVVDAAEQTVAIAAFPSGRVQAVGRQGSGPGEYRFPMRLFRLGGDSVGIEDGGNGRILVLRGNGTPGAVLDRLGGRLTGSPVAGESPSRSDAAGNLYAIGNSEMSPDGLKSADSAPIERWRPGSVRRDTVAWMPLPPAADRVLPPGETSRGFATEVQWIVGEDGRIAILHPNPYSVDLIDPSARRTRGQSIPYEKVRVSEADKARWRDEQVRPRPVVIMRPGAPAPVSGLRRGVVFEPVRWPSHLPPFEENAGRFAPDGVLWVRRSTTVGARSWFDLIGRRGELVRRVSAPERLRLAGFGRSHAYVVRTDADLQEFLERYDLAALRN